MSTIIQCPNCSTRYRLKFVIEDGQQVRCPTCQTVWRFQSEAEAEAPPEESAVEEAPARQQPVEEPGYGAPASDMHAGYGDKNSSDSERSYLDDGDGEPVEDSASDETPSAGEALYAGYDAAQSDMTRFSLREQQEFAQTARFETDVSRAEDSFEDETVDYTQGSPAASVAAGSEVGGASAGADWAATLAGAINRAGFEPRTRYDYESDETLEAQRKPAASAYADDDDADAFSGQQENPDETDAKTLAAERLSAFWRGERAATTFDEEAFKSLGDRMPVRQPQDDWDEKRPKGGLAVAAAWGVYLAVVSGALASAVFFREAVVEAMPGAASYYESVGLPVAIESLGFENVTYEWVKRGEKSVLEVRGDVINLSNADVRVPLLHISVRDDQSAEIAKTIAVIVKDPLAPGAKTAFTLEFLSPPKRIGGVELQFGA